VGLELARTARPGRGAAMSLALTCVPASAPRATRAPRGPPVPPLPPAQPVNSVTAARASARLVRRAGSATPLGCRLAPPAPLAGLAPCKAPPWNPVRAPVARAPSARYRVRRPLHVSGTALRGTRAPRAPRPQPRCCVPLVGTAPQGPPAACCAPWARTATVWA
jgi:hypothetical protein